MMAHTPFAYLYELLGWRQALLVDGLVGAVFITIIFFVVQDKPEHSLKADSVSTQGQKFSFINALANPQNWLAGLYTALLNLPILVLCALWGGSYLHVVHHLSDIAASNVVSLIFMGSIIGCPIVGWLSDHWGQRKPLMLLGSVATLLVCVPLFMDINLSQFDLSVLFFILGFVTSTQVISYPLIAESNQNTITGSATGIASVIIMGGGGVAQVLFGWLMTYHTGNAAGHYTLDDFQFAMWMFPIAAIASLVAVFLMRETYCKRTKE